ncbi:MAG: hypothetical protein KGI27_15495, partial [Thaumarchaeota archaeon]|nr:hypothetical protein [Nitrososphaerota archaeon]
LAGTITLPNSNTLTGVSNFTQFSNGISVGGATTYNITTTTSNLNTLQLQGNLYQPVSGGISGYFQLANNVIAPSNTINDLAIGGNSTSSALFQVFGATGNATTSG